jgi:hypothetical protein
MAEPQLELEAPLESSFPRPPQTQRIGGLLLVLTVIGVGVALLLDQQGQLPAEVRLWWPLTLIVPGGLWFLGSLVRRSGRGLLGSAALVGAGMSLLLDAQAIYSAGSTLVGISLISVGASIVVRGLLMGRQPIGVD